MGRVPLPWPLNLHLPSPCHILFHCCLDGQLDVFPTQFCPPPGLALRHGQDATRGGLHKANECQCVANVWTEHILVQLKVRAVIQAYIGAVFLHEAVAFATMMLYTLGIMLGLFQKLSWGGHIFCRQLHPQDKHGVGAPQPPGHVSALINPPHYGSNMP